MKAEPSIPTREKFQIAGFYLIFLFFFGLVFRFTIFSYILWDVYETFIYIAIALGIVYLMAVLPLQKKDKMNQRAMGIEFIDCTIVKDKVIAEPFFLGINKCTKLTLNFDDDESLKSLFDSKRYKDMSRKMLRDEKGKDFGKRALPAAITETYIKEIEKKYDELAKKAALKEEAEEELSKAEKEELLKREEEIKAAKEAIKAYKNFSLEEIPKEEKERLKNLQVYYCEMYDKERFENDDEEKGFDKLILVMHDDISRVLKTKAERGYYKGWEIDIRSVNAFLLLLADITDTMPLLYVVFSENMTDGEIHTIETMRSESLTYIELKIMEQLLFHLAALPSALLLEVKKQEARANTFEESYNHFLQGMAKDNLIYSKFAKNPIQDELREENHLLKRNLQVLKVAMLAFVVIVGLVFLFLFSGTGFFIQAPPEIPDEVVDGEIVEETTRSILQLIKFNRFFKK